MTNCDVCGNPATMCCRADRFCSFRCDRCPADGTRQEPLAQAAEARARTAPRHEDPAERLKVMASTPGVTIQVRTETTIRLTGTRHDVARAVRRAGVAAEIMKRGCASIWMREEEAEAEALVTV